MNSRWIRLDTTWSQSEWVSALEPEARLAWIELLCHVKAHGYAGSVKRLTPAVAARLWSLRVTAVTDMESAAIADDALVVDGDEWVVTGWSGRQSDPKAAERMRRYRERQQQVTEESPEKDVTRNSRNVTDVTPTKTKTETKTERTTRSKKRRTVVYSPEFSEVWAIHPRGPKEKAQDEYTGAVPSSIEHTELLRLLNSYVSTEISERFKGHDLFRWIRDERWEQERAKTNGKPQTPVRFYR